MRLFSRTLCMPSTTWRTLTLSTSWIQLLTASPRSRWTLTRTRCVWYGMVWYISWSISSFICNSMELHTIQSRIEYQEISAIPNHIFRPCSCCDCFANLRGRLVSCLQRPLWQWGFWQHIIPLDMRTTGAQAVRLQRINLCYFQCFSALVSQLLPLSVALQSNIRTQTVFDLHALSVQHCAYFFHQEIQSTARLVRMTWRWPGLHSTVCSSYCAIKPRSLECARSIRGDRCSTNVGFWLRIIVFAIPNNLIKLLLFYKMWSKL